jgi:hypothetical protein
MRLTMWYPPRSQAIVTAGPIHALLLPVWRPNVRLWRFHTLCGEEEWRRSESLANIPMLTFRFNVAATQQEVTCPQCLRALAGQP